MTYGNFYALDVVSPSEALVSLHKFILREQRVSLHGWAKPAHEARYCSNVRANQGYAFTSANT